jgi:hypothetical protein
VYDNTGTPQALFGTAVIIPIETQKPGRTSAIQRLTFHDKGKAVPVLN